MEVAFYLNGKNNENMKTKLRRNKKQLDYSQAPKKITEVREFKISTFN